MNFEQWHEENKYGTLDVPVFKEYARKAFQAGIAYAESGTFAEKLKRWLGTDKPAEPAEPIPHIALQTPQNYFQIIKNNP